MASTERENKRSKGVKNTDHMNTKEEIYTYVTEQTKKLGHPASSLLLGSC